MNSEDTTKWDWSIAKSTGGPVASLTVTTNGNLISPFRIKGVCYSPCPIGGSNNNAPSIGDWFWDTYKSGDTTIQSWEETWSRDLLKIKKLGANTIRVYCMLSEQLPEHYNEGLVFTHNNFLDACYSKGLFVLVGFPMPQEVFYKDEEPNLGINWWTTNLKSTIKQLASHPAILGFTIANEVDNGAVNTYENESKTNTVKVKYFWDQVENIAKLSKKLAPDKLIGIANHDDPNICKKASSYMEKCTSVDFWGINTYQPDSFVSIFGNSETVGYSTIPKAALKPTILTEYGFPSTSRKSVNTLKPEKIYSDSTTQKNVANVLSTMLPKAQAEQLNLGVCYFEFCDEWWNQSTFNITPVTSTCRSATGANTPTPGNGGPFVSPNDYTWYGGPVACGFPNYYWDNEGFGLYSVGVAEGRSPANPWEDNAPALPLDTRTARPPLIAALTDFYKKSFLSGVVVAIDKQPGKPIQVGLSSDQYGRPPATGKGSLTNYFYEPNDITAAEEAQLSDSKNSGKYVTLTLEGRNVTSVIVGN
ncbi:MAG: hypothetical protein AAFN93_06390 [Bacteroidota bacterium]